MRHPAFCYWKSKYGLTRTSGSRPSSWLGQVQQGSINTYLILVDLPQGLTANYGEILDFKHEISGIADVIVRDRRLIQRLFDNLRYRTKAK